MIDYTLFDEAVKAEDYNRLDELVKGLFPMDEFKQLAEDAVKDFTTAGGVEMPFEDVEMLLQAEVFNAIDNNSITDLLAQIDERYSDYIETYDVLSDVQFYIYDEIKERFEGAIIGTPIKVDLKSVELANDVDTGSHNCVNFYVNVEAKTSFRGYEIGDSISINVYTARHARDKKAEASISDGVDVSVDFDNDYYFDYSNNAISEAILKAAQESGKLDRVIEFEAVEAKRLYDTKDICPECGQEMEWEMDFSVAEFSRGGTMLNLDDAIDGGGYVCNNEDCITRYFNI